MENRIKELRRRHHMSQIHLSIELEVSQETISAYENGKYYPSFPTLVRLSQIFGTSIDYLMGISDAETGTGYTSSKEKLAMDLFRSFNAEEQDRTLGYMQALSELHLS